MFDLVDACYLTGLLKKGSQSGDSNFKDKSHEGARFVISKLSFQYD